MKIMTRLISLLGKRSGGSGPLMLYEIFRFDIWTSHQKFPVDPFPYFSRVRSQLSTSFMEAFWC
jgi:hypothetical protein